MPHLSPEEWEAVRLTLLVAGWSVAGGLPVALRRAPRHYKRVGRTRAAACTDTATATGNSAGKRR